MFWISLIIAFVVEVPLGLLVGDLSVMALGVPVLTAIIYYGEKILQEKKRQTALLHESQHEKDAGEKADAGAK